MTDTEEKLEKYNTDILIACTHFLGTSLGAKSVQIRYSDDEEPVVWFLVVEFQHRNGPGFYETGAALDPNKAAARLCEVLVDGGMCVHCGKPTGFAIKLLTDDPLGRVVCWYEYDPELKKIRRGCE